MYKDKKHTLTMANYTPGSFTYMTFSQPATLDRESRASGQKSTPVSLKSDMIRPKELLNLAVSLPDVLLNFHNAGDFAQRGR